MTFIPSHQQVFKVYKCPRLELGPEGQTKVSAFYAHQMTGLSGSGPSTPQLCPTAESLAFAHLHIPAEVKPCRVLGSPQCPPALWGLG